MTRPGPLRAATMAALLILAPAPLLLAQERPSESDAKATVDALKRDIQALDTRLESTREARSDAGRQLEKVETALADIHHRLDALQAERRQLDDEIASLETRQRELQAQQATQRQALGEQVAALYRLGDTPQLKLLLNQDDPARLDRMQTYLNYLADARRARIEALARLDRELADNRESLTQRRSRLDALLSELDAQSATLASRMRERQALVAKLDARYASEQSRLEDLRQDRAHAERVLEQVRRELKRLEQPPPSTAIAKTQGKLPWPVQGKVVSTYGSGDGVNRNGLLIAAAEGTPVRAIHPGRVVFADWMRGFGNLLIVDHGDDIMSLYAHVQRFDVSVGDRVTNDQVIAAVGNTGGRPSPGLYFEVRRNGDPIDPRRWISQR